MNELPTKEVYKSKTNWFVNLPLFAIALLASLPDVLQDPTVAAHNPLGSKTKWILWGVAIINIYLRNFGKQSILTVRNTPPSNPEQSLTNHSADVILNSDDVQSPNQGYRISNEIPKEAGGPNG